MTDAAVVVRLHRGLGNKLFQFAAGHALARRLDAPLHCLAGNHNELIEALLGDRLVPATGAELWRCGIVRPTSGTPSAVATLALAAGRGRRGTSAVVGRVTGRPPRCFVVPSAHHYDSDFGRLDAPCYLFGYFQHQAYWRDVADELATAIATSLGPVAPNPADVPVVGLHVRRTDFVGAGSALEARYYREALARLTTEIDRPVLRLVGDDRSFLRDLGRELQAEGHRVEDDPDGRGEGADDHRRVDVQREDLARLAGCDHLILSNSTFAWWAAAVGDVRPGGGDRRVLVPERWARSCDSAVLLRPGWETVPSDLAPAGSGGAPGFADWWAGAAAPDPT
jgi:hypothetical protein